MGIHEDARALADNADLRQRLEEAEEVIRAIRSGAVDAFVVEEAHGNRVYTLDSADRPYRLLVEQMQQGAVTLNADGAIAYCNRRFAELVDTPHVKLIGTDFYTFLLPEERELCATLLTQAGTGGGQGEAHLRRTDGRAIPVFLTFNALPHESGVAFGILVTDLTTQRRHDQLDAAVGALEESDRLKNEFLAMLAHELRNPLAPIRNAVHLMRMAPGDATVPAATSSMLERQVAQMVRLIDDLLDVSRINRGKIELRKERIDLVATVGHALDACRSDMEKSNHALSVCLPPGPVYADGDPARLAQVVSNLLSNARKFTENGGEIGLSLERAGGEAVIRVRDNGIGVAEGQLTRIFEMFLQVDSSLERSASGLGIGLTLVRTLVELHGGSVEAFSAGAGRGSEFVVRLPIVELMQGPVPAPTLPEPAAGPSRRILVVDDNLDSAQSLAALLEWKGHDTRKAYDGEDALEAADAFRPEVVLLDLGLPKLNGYQVCRRLRAQSWGTSMTIICVSGWGHKEDLALSKDAGFDAHLVKPVNVVALMKLVDRAEIEAPVLQAQHPV